MRLLNPSGLCFEDSIIDKIVRTSEKAWGKKSVRFVTKKEDTFFGTDLFVLGVPIDFTLSFSKSSHTQRLHNAFQVGGITIEMGLRRGNGRCVFETPVLVLGFDVPVHVNKNNSNLIIATIEDELQNILEIGMDEYFAVC